MILDRYNVRYNVVMCVCKHELEQVKILNTSDNTWIKCSVLNTVTAISYLTSHSVGNSFRAIFKKSNIFRMKNSLISRKIDLMSCFRINALYITGPLCVTVRIAKNSCLRICFRKVV